MSKLIVAHIVFALITIIAWLVIGMQIFGLGRINPDVLLPWAYTAGVGNTGLLICSIIRLHRLEKRDK